MPLGNAPHDTRLIVGEVVWIHLREDVLEDAGAGADPTNILVDAERLLPIARLGKNLYSKLGERFALDRPKPGL